MTAKNVCNFEKFGYCKKKRDCKDYHPTEACKNRNCNISRCRRRHPKKCKYFESGYCKFKESCKYDHAEKIRVNDLLDRIIKLEKQNLMFREINEQQDYAISNLNERLSKAKIEKNILLRKLSTHSEQEKNFHENTLVTDDHMETDTNTKDQNQPPTEAFKNQIKFTVEVQTAVEETIKSINSEESFVEAKTILKDFQDKLNESVKKTEVKAAFTGKDDEVLSELIGKLNLECNKLLTKTLRTNFFKSFLSDKLKDFLNELIKIRNTKTSDRKRKNIGQ